MNHFHQSLLNDLILFCDDTFDRLKKTKHFCVFTLYSTIKGEDLASKVYLRLRLLASLLIIVGLVYVCGGGGWEGRWRVLDT